MMSKNSGYVYFIYSQTEEKHPHIKIGMTDREVDKRKKDLDTGNPFELVTYGKIKTTAPEFLEKTLHHAFKDYRRKGEWFEIKRRTVDEIISAWASAGNTCNRDFRKSLIEIIEKLDSYSDNSENTESDESSCSNAWSYYDSSEESSEDGGEDGSNDSSEDGSNDSSEDGSNDDIGKIITITAPKMISLVESSDELVESSDDELVERFKKLKLI